MSLSRLYLVKARMSQLGSIVRALYLKYEEDWNNLKFQEEIKRMSG